MCSKEDSGHGRHAQLTHVHADTFWLNAFLCILCAHAMQFYGTLHSTLTIMPQLASTKYLSHKISSSLITSLAIGRYKVPLACVCVWHALCQKLLCSSSFPWSLHTYEVKLFIGALWLAISTIAKQAACVPHMLRHAWSHPSTVSTQSDGKAVC